MRKRFFVVSMIAIAVVSVCAAQSNDTLEMDLANHYVGRSFPNYQPYLNREVWYDREGKITENPTPVCTSLYGNLAVTRVRVRGDEIDIEATRSGMPSPRSGQPVWPSYASREIVLRYQSKGQPWTAQDFDRAFQNSLQVRSKFDLYPPGATAPPPDSDRHIAFFMNGAPIYRVGSGVTAPRQMGRLMDPEYTESARRAKAGGTVLLRFIVNEDGSVSDVMTGQPPLGFGLDEQAIRTVKQWRLTPAMLDGQPVKVDLRAETNFCLY